MHPTIAEQLAAMHRRELQEEAMMPYQMYELYEIERPKTVAEIRLADEHAARIAGAVAALVRPLARAGRRRRSVPDRMAADHCVEASCRSDMMSTTMEVR
jgi:hypothetical protein